MSTLNASVFRPNSLPRRAREITLADQIMFLLGRQATFGHAPPSRPRSTIAVRRRLSRVHAANLPAIPLPIITSSNFSALIIWLPPKEKIEAPVTQQVTAENKSALSHSK